MIVMLLVFDYYNLHSFTLITSAPLNTSLKLRLKLQQQPYLVREMIKIKSCETAFNMLLFPMAQIMRIAIEGLNQSLFARDRIPLFS